MGILRRTRIIKTLVNKANPAIRIIAPEIVLTVNKEEYWIAGIPQIPRTYLAKDWTLVEEETEKKTKYLRFGDIPENGKSKIWRGEECVGEEEGVSVYEIKYDKEKNIFSVCLPFPFHRDTLDTLCVLTKYDNRPCYTVTGEYVGKGTDGEPLISNVQIEEEFPKIISDEKMEQMGEQISKAAVDNIKEQFSKIIEEEPEVELEEFTEKMDAWKARFNHPDDIPIKATMAFTARMFYQYPDVARQWYEQLPKTTMD